jgi:hypothetical protein
LGFFHECSDAVSEQREVTAQRLNGRLVQCGSGHERRIVTSHTTGYKPLWNNEWMTCQISCYEKLQFNLKGLRGSGEM